MATGTRETSVGAAHTARDAAWRQDGYAHNGGAEWSGRRADFSADGVPSPRSAHEARPRGPSFFIEEGGGEGKRKEPGILLRETTLGGRKLKLFPANLGKELERPIRKDGLRV